MSTNRQLSPLPRVPKVPSPHAYDRTDEENLAISKAEVHAHFHPEKPEPTPPYTEKQKEWAVGFLNTPSQYELHHKPDDYACTLMKQVAQLMFSKDQSKQIR